jgi:hypothetical protein
MAEAYIGPAAAVSDQPRILRRLNDLFTSWMQAVVPTAAAHMFVSGSYKLGVDVTSDIDVVFVVPAGITRRHVFEGFAAVLEAAADVTELQVLPNARVPLIGLRLAGQELDVATCHLMEPTLPSRASLLTSYEWMNGLDDASVLAFNGPRVTETMIARLKEVADSGRSYLVALRVLRTWAKRRGVYNNKAGYFGGVNLALLLLTVLTATRTADELLTAFFARFAKWDWKVPIEIVTDHDESACPVYLQAKEWSKASSARDAVVLLTPCYPRFNSMYSAMPCTRDVMRRELVRAAALAPEWRLVCAPLVALATCQRFLRVVLTGTVQWVGYMQTQVRFLVQYLSNEELGVKEFRHIPKWVDSASPRADDIVSAASYITADDDGIVRTYVMKGTLEEPLAYFQRAHGTAGPLRTRECSVTVDYVGAADLPVDILPAAEDVALSAEADAAVAVKRAARVVKDDVARTAVATPSIPKPLPPVPSWFPTTKLRYLGGGVFRALPEPPPLPPAAVATKVVHLRVERGGGVAPAYDVYIGPPWRALRPAPFLQCSVAVEEFPSRADWLAAYKADLESRVRTCAATSRAVRACHGKTLACWCVPQLCHGHVIADVANALSAS